MTKKMLIDDTHQEETRVVILDGNKIEDVEFETSSRKQIKGNIYLAKVMRVEPSLQAAFVDYGGNRHGFLAFGEIHPDYYHISEDILAEIDKEVDGAIEAKKQALREREEHQQRQRGERARRQAEEKALRAEAEAAKKQERAEAAAESVALPETAETVKPAEEGAEPSETAEAAADSKDGKPVKKRLAKKRMRKEQGQKTLAAASEIEEMTVSRECACLPEDTGYAKDEAMSSEYIDDDDDDEDSEQDFELQRRLMKVRKLFHRSNIQDVILEGQIVMVQVIKEERGNKGAALTTYLSLAGRYCVLMPNRIKSGGVSRKITNMADRKRLKSIIRELPMTADMSMIVRTAGEDKTKPDIVRDYNYLMRIWNQIRLNALQSKAPYLVHEEANLIKRALRDMYTKDVSEIIVDGEASYQAAREFMKMLSPHSLKKLKATRKGDIPLFQRFQIEAQLDKLHDTNVQLNSGGYLVINPTEALVAIDVNSGRATKEKDIEETALKTNLEAADEIAKQLRLRNLAGLIVIDFIDMDEQKNNLAVEKRMKEAMKSDRARIQIGRMSCFGLLEISRQRMHSSFFESNYQTCPYCHGKGIVRTVESGALFILRAIEEEGAKSRSSKLNLYLPSNVAIYLLNERRKSISDIEKRYNMNIVICADDSIKNIADYRIERTKLTKAAAQSQSQLQQTEPVFIEPEAFEEGTEETVASAAVVEEKRPEEGNPGRNERNDRNERGFRNHRNNRRNRHGRDGRDNRDRDRNRGERREGHNGGYQPRSAEQKQKSEAIILYNSHGDVPPSAAKNTQEARGEGQAKKGTWWRKLIS